MQKPACRACRQILVALLAAVLGAGAGVAVLVYGGSRELSMAATFVGAVLPVAWWVRQNRGNDGDSR